MIFEIADIEVKAGEEERFEQAARTAEPLFLRAKGCLGMELHKTIEHPSRYKLIVRWNTVDDHMEGFRGSDDFAEWRRLIGPYVATPPAMVHTQRVLG